MFGIGIEYREDEINSIPDDVARDGLFFGFFSDGGAVGEKWTKEYFAELDIVKITYRCGRARCKSNDPDINIIY